MMSDVKTNILLVDDLPQNLLALEAILEPLGQNLVTAHSGPEALKQLLTRDFAVILLDVQMPGMDGFETAALIKEREKTRHIPIIFLTAISKDQEYVFKGYTVGAVDYIAKPFEPNILRSKVSVFVDLFKKNEQIRRQGDLLREAEQRERERELAALKLASERRYKALAESMPQIVWTASADGAMTYCNQRWYDYTGLSIEKSQRLGRVTALHPDDVGAYLSRWNDALRTGRDCEAEYRLRRGSDGCYRWHLERAVPVAEEQSGEVSWIGTSTDIDDRKRAEQALEFLAEASRTLASSLDFRETLTGVARLSVQALCDWSMVVMLEEDGAPKPLAVAHRDAAKSDLAHELERDHEIDPDAPYGPAQTIRTGEPELVPEVPDAMLVAMASSADHIRCLRELGVASYICVPLVSRERTLGAIFLASSDEGRRYGETDLALAQDVARRAATAVDNARLYAIAQRERARLEEASRAKDEFLATLSHELRTPLNSMLGWTQLLRTGKLDEATFARALETIERNTKSQAQLIADLLDVSRIITGKLHLNTRLFDLAPVVEAAIDAVRHAAAGKNIELFTIFDERIDAVNGDPDRLQQVVWNLLSNAIKFTPEGGRVEVRLERGDGHATIKVSDNGQGIKTEFLPYVFDRFRQADASSTRVHGGLGLGLAIVRHLVELHGGTVSVESEGEGRGATFSVGIPTAGTEEAAPLDSGEWTRPSDAAIVRDLSGLHVLVVEDEEDGRDLLAAVLEECGARVSMAASANEAFERFEAERPDLLLSDIGLPGEDGYALIRRIRALGPDHGGDVPAVALTAYAAPNDRARALAAGFHQHVAKPVEPADLTAVIAKLSGRRKDGRGRRQQTFSET